MKAMIGARNLSKPDLAAAIQAGTNKRTERTGRARQAAIRAGYSKKTAYSQGQRLLKNVEAAAAIKAGADKRANWNLSKLVIRTCHF